MNNVSSDALYIKLSEPNCLRHVGTEGFNALDADSL